MIPYYFFVAWFIGGYLLGSVPFGLVLTRMAGLGDIRKIGSGNIGATNVLRTGRKDLAFLTLLLDGGKAAAAALIAYHLPQQELIANFFPDMDAVSSKYALENIQKLGALLTGAAAVVGHNFPIFLKFKGGKGVAATLGMMLAVYWQVGVAACATWLFIAALYRYSSLAALSAITMAPVFAYLMGTKGYAIVFGLLAVLSWIRHRENIKRLIKKEETQISFSKKKKEDES